VELFGFDGALEYFDVVTVIDFEMEGAGFLQESAGVAFEIGTVEAEEIGIRRSAGCLCCRDSTKQQGCDADLARGLHKQTVRPDTRARDKRENALIRRRPSGA
jgi:hypothetical protein